MKRVLLVGVGRFGENHLRVLSGLGVPLGVVDVDARALERAKVLVPDARCGQDLGELLADAWAASVVVPAREHRAVATRCLEAGLAVFCEKPLAPTTEDACAIAALASASGAVLQTGFIFRYHPATVVARSLIAEGAIGKPHTVRARFTGFKRPRTDGGCAVNDAVHFVDLASTIFGKEPLRAQGATRDFLGTGSEDVAFLAFDYGPELCHVEASYHTPERARHVLVVGDKGSIAVDYDRKDAPVSLRRQWHERRAGGAIVAEEAARVETPPVADREPLRAELEDFLENARARRRPGPCGWAGARATAAIEAALRAAREGRIERVPSVGP